MPRLRAAITPAQLLLLAIVAVGFALRVWNNDYGLPYVWSLDEAIHFASRAVAMFREGPDPGYYQNPTLYTYLLHGVLRGMYGQLGFVFELRHGNVPDQAAIDPTEIWVVARTLAAVLGCLGVAAVYAAARRLWGVREGLVAAAVLSLGFLPVVYSRIAVSDVGSLIGVAIAVLGSVRAYEDGCRRDFLIAGLGAGLAISFKYTSGLVLVALGVAALARLVPFGRPAATRGERGTVMVSLALGLTAAALVFLATNPYLILNFERFTEDLREQADIAASRAKAGQTSTGLPYYLDSLTWGLGWAALAAAIGGLVVEARRDPVRALILLALPVALIAYLSLQTRSFGRWLLPAYPALAMLAAVGLVRASELVRGSPRARAAALAALTGACLLQPLAADVRSAQVLGRKDTREEARDYLTSRHGPELRVAIEPAIPGRYFRVGPAGDDPPWLRRCRRRPGWTEPGWSFTTGYRERVCTRFKPQQFARPDTGVRGSAYHFFIGPQVVDWYRDYGYCLVLTISLVRDRAERTGLPRVRAYYRRLERESRLVREFSPFDPGAEPVPFHYDLSYNYYPAAFERPGPTVRLYRLRNCRQRYGAPAIRIPKGFNLPWRPETFRELGRAQPPAVYSGERRAIAKARLGHQVPVCGPPLHLPAENPGRPIQR